MAHRKVIMSREDKELMADNPEMAETIRKFIEEFRNAELAVERGQYKTIDEALDAIGHTRVSPEEAERLGLHEMFEELINDEPKDN